MQAVLSSKSCIGYYLNISFVCRFILFHDPDYKCKFLIMCKRLFAISVCFAQINLCIERIKCMCALCRLVQRLFLHRILCSRSISEYVHLQMYTSSDDQNKYIILSSYRYPRRCSGDLTQSPPMYF